MIETQTDSVAALRAGKPWCELLPDADGSVDTWDSAILCGAFEESGPQEVRMLDAIYLLVAYE